MLRRAALAALAATACAACDSLGSQQGYAPAQPIAFSHAAHAGQSQIHCQYCHYGAQQSRHAGLPAVSVCLNCHTQVLKDSAEVQKIAQAMQSGKPIEWIKVHRLPDFAFFSHANHIKAGGLKCQDCHGAVEQMVRVEQVNTFSMGFCLDCHRTMAADPARAGKPPPTTDCAACHR